MSRSAFIALWLTIAVSGCRSSANQGAADLAPVFRSSIVFSATPAALEQGVFAESVDFQELRDLYVRVFLAGMPRIGMLTLIFVNPNGEVFYVDGAHYAIEPTVPMIDSPELEHPVPVLAAKKVNGGDALDRAVAIGGTNFQRYPVPSGTREYEITRLVTLHQQPESRALRRRAGAISRARGSR